ncbi:MAG TPA: hypothetical protein VJ821_09395 [Anaerolineales bacterium]|nr:hypothetical protein [Anaerolineales bacterium]
MRKKLSRKLILVTILVAVTSLGFFILEESEVEVSINGVVCNHSSTGVWLALSKGESTGTYALAPDQCTNIFRQDVEAIWGKDCSADSCQYQAWKLGAGRFTVYNNAESPAGSVLRISGWGAGSRWHITEDWPKPDLSSIEYSLVK